jgi:N-acyl-D-amino-acid deacylase
MQKMISFFFFVAITTSAFSAAIAQADARYDVVITNARIVDGTGNPWFRGSIAVKDGRIARVGWFDHSGAKQTIDAKGQIVAPGFIDVHAHSENVFDQPNAENFIRMGVTTLITGNCGGSHVDVGKFLGTIKEKPLAINISTLIGHNSVRESVMGLNNRAPTEEEQKRMNELVEQAMKDGAVGLSTGLIYLPGTFARTEEVIELAKAASKYGGTYASHIRDEGTGVFDAINEAINIGEQAKMPVEISHFKISARSLWGESEKTLGLVREARARGLTVTVDQYAYPASSTSLDVRLPNWAVAGGRDEGRKRLADPETRLKIIEDMKKGMAERGFDDYAFAYVATYRPNIGFNGKNIAQITKQVRGKDDLDSQIEQILEMYEAGGAQMVYQVMSEVDVKRIMAEPFTMFASDSGIRELGAGVPHPRGYGNNARVLGRYVRELKIITLEDAIRKMTSLPANTFGFRDRGQIREGFAADIVIFDEKTVGDKATFENPHQYAVGFSTVIVGGGIVFDGTKMTGTMSGQAIRGNGAEQKSKMLSGETKGQNKFAFEFEAECGTPLVESQIFRVREGTVIKIIDGDTVQIRDKQRTIWTVELAGVDSSQNHERAAEILTKRLLGENVVFIGNPDNEKKDIIEAIVKRKGDEINRFLVENGHAAFRKTEYGYAVSRYTLCVYSNLIKRAKAAKLGIWASN